MAVTSRGALVRLATILGSSVPREFDGTRAPTRPTGQLLLDDHTLYAAVRAAHHHPYEGHVHNLEVDGEHSFCLPSAALHNCEVNGPGEARAADIGVAGGKGIGLIFKNGEVIRKVPESEIVQAMREEVEKFITERHAASAAAGTVAD